MSGKVGAPTLYKPEYCELLIKHMEEGLSFEAFAGVARVARSTLYDWIDAHPEFKEAKEIGTSLSLLKWEGEGLNGLWDETEYENGKPSFKKSLNTTAWIFNMKNRFSWKDRQPDEVAQINQSQSQETKVVSDEQLAELVKIARGQK